MRREEKELILYCDGSCEGGGSEAVGHYAYVLYHGTEIILEGTGEAGSGSEMTVNVAEYIAVLRGLEALRTAGYSGSPVRVCSDSKLVMQQLGMLCAVRSQRLIPWWCAVRAIARCFDVHFEWVPRTWNHQAHQLLQFGSRKSKGNNETP